MNPAVILLHGLAGSQRWWRYNLGPLREHFCVHAIDVPGHGGMRQDPSEFAVATAAEWLLRRIDTIEPGARVSLVGHSTGGLICAMLAAMEPGRVHRMVLAAPAIDLRRRRITSNLLPLAQGCLTTSPSFWPTLLVDSVRAGPGLLLRTARELLTIHAMPVLPAIEAPTLLVWGERDPLVPVSCAPAIHSAIAGSELRVIPGAGHVVMWDAPTEFNAAVVGFLRRR